MKTKVKNFNIVGTRYLLVLFMAFMIHGPTLSQDAVKTIEIKVLPGLQFDLARFQVKPGTKVRLTFTNTDDMDHNLLITKPGSREKVVNAALALGGDGPSKDFIPSIPEVLWSIPVISAEQIKLIEFTAPKEEGVYPYVCTYPGHGFVMYGAMYVSSKEEMPEIEKDTHIPPSRRTKVEANDHSEHESGHSLNAAVQKPPFLYRVYIDGASPAAIAVRLTENLSYCWDAGTCRLRFAWDGLFVDNTALWKGHKDAESVILGNVFYRDKVSYPLRIKDRNSIPQIDYKGYRLIDNYPEFHYTVDGFDVFEMIKPNEDQSGLMRTFRIPKATNKVWFHFSEDDGVDYKTSMGNLSDGVLELSSSQAKEFSIMMTERKKSI